MNGEILRLALLPTGPMFIQSPKTLQQLLRHSCVACSLCCWR